MSLRIFDGFKFAKLQTPLHTMDPRVKFILVMVIFTVALLFSNIFALVIIFLLQIPLVAVGKVFRRWSASLKGGGVLAALIFIMNFLTGQTLEFSAAMTLRFLCLLSSFSIFFMTTSPDDLGLALEQARVPYTVSFTFTTAVRLVPTMAIDAQTVIDAQRSRGLELEKGSFIRRVKNYIPILIPLIVSAIRRSIELAEALESRAFGAAKKRESFVRLEMRPTDYFVLASSLLCLCVAVYLYLYVPLPTFEISIKLPSIWPWA